MSILFKTAPVGELLDADEKAALSRVTVHILEIKIPTTT